MSNSVIAKITELAIPTYGLGKPEVNPMFFEKRVYQGSSGKVYPIPFIDKIYDIKSDKKYVAAILENELIKLTILPEIGGRVFEAQDKTNNNYNFFYQQKVIKPALVGLAGPWISGGIEFNWPQHHRPGTFLPTDTYIEVEDDGSKTIWMSAYDPMYHLKGMHGIRLRPDSALIELRGRLFNRTPLAQTFLWWANVAVEVHKDYRSFFPPDVHYVADHAVRDMCSFPSAQNTYYGIPYLNRRGENDLRNYHHIPVPTSFMVCETGYDFFGGYDFNAQGGFVHVANRHIAPGKKQWTWGNAAFGQAWDRELTDEGGPYFELMAGVYTDNQPDFSYLLPYETKTFSQFWWSYQKLGPLQEANKDLAVRLEIRTGNFLDWGVVSSKKIEHLQITLTIGSNSHYFPIKIISPNQPWIEKRAYELSGSEDAISLCVTDKEGNELIAYHHKKVEHTRNRKIAVAPKQPSKINSANELELIGEHLELYRHPTRQPQPYWEAAIELDPRSYKAHIALGKVSLKSGQFESAMKHFHSAIEITTRFHPNPASGEAHYFCALAMLYLGDRKAAYTLFYKATWNFEWRSAAYFQLAALDCINADFPLAMQHLEASLDTNRQNNKAIILKAIIQKRLGKPEIATNTIDDLLLNDSLDQWAKCEQANLSGNFRGFLTASRNDGQTIINVAFDYAEAGLYDEAINLIELHQDHKTPSCAVPNPMAKSMMTQFILAWLYGLNNNLEKSNDILNNTSTGSYDYLFPSRIYEQLVLEWVLEKDSQHTVAAYALGNYYYNLKRHEDAIAAWEMAVAANCHYGTLYRNLGIAYWNVRKDRHSAREAFIKAIRFSPEDVRIRYEYDQLRKKLNDSPRDRLRDLELIKDQIIERDDFSVELAALYNFNYQYPEALHLMTIRTFHPWEGGEGKVLRQYTYANLKLGEIALNSKEPQVALDYFRKSLDTPDNLGEKYHHLQANAHINYWKGRALKALGMKQEANRHFLKSSSESGDFMDASISTYSEISYFKALSLIELSRKDEAETLLTNIRSYGENMLKEKVEIDYFATSLPLLLVFEDDLQRRQIIEAKYLILLVDYVHGAYEAVEALAKEILSLDSMHVGAKDILVSVRGNL
ncbi:MAG: DUF5107 domain-containing protein [Saprospiraceae bacterium]|nr:DUF5107 domain-containing protein [Saprospiraceae bacterium]